MIPVNVREGPAVRDDGSLKDASEMEWPNSPSDLSPVKLSEDGFSLKRKSYATDESDDELPTAKVTHILG